MDAAYRFAQKTESDLFHASYLIEETQYALAQCQTSLVICQTELQEERIDHGLSRQELQLERQNHKETEALLDITFDAAQQSNQRVRDLQRQIDLLLRPPTPDINLKDLEVHLQLARARLNQIEDMISSETPRASCET